jgi:toxin-antitoxin system PIN domain toxin
MSRVALLDVNVLVALFDPDHVHHELAHNWFADHHSNGWATCPATENGFLCVLANPAYGAAVTRCSELAARLRRFCESDDHTFWADEVSLRDPALFDPAFIAGHRQITDVYLLGLAKRKGGCLATFDRAIALKAARGAGRDSLLLIAP